jgi:predicted ester cyclase
MSLDENKAIVDRILSEFWLGGNVGVLDELLASDCINHEQSNPELRGKGFPDFNITVEDVVAEDDKVVKRFVFSGTHTGEFAGIPPTGKQVTMRGITLYRLARGKVSEIYWNYDVFGLLQQLGAIPAPGQQPAGATA